MAQSLTSIAAILIVTTIACMADRTHAITRRGETSTVVERVQIEQEDAKVERHIHEIHSQYSYHQEAYTKWFFHFLPQLAYEVVSTRDTPTGAVVQVRIKTIKSKISLPIHVYLPPDADERTVAHELGHVAICKHIYSTAKTEAQKCAESVVGQYWAGEGIDRGSATAAAVKRAGTQLSTCYRAATVDRVEIISSAYDQLERDKKFSVSDAIKMAEEKDPWKGRHVD